MRFDQGFFSCFNLRCWLPPLGRGVNGSTDGLSHLLGAEKLWSSRAVALSGVSCGIREGRDSNSRNILIGRWCVATIVVYPGKDAEMRGQPIVTR